MGEGLHVCHCRMEQGKALPLGELRMATPHMRQGAGDTELPRESSSIGSRKVGLGQQCPASRQALGGARAIKSVTDESPKLLIY